MQSKSSSFVSVNKKPDVEIDKLWAKEAGERLTAYRRGEIKALDLNQVLTKYQARAK